MNEFEREVYDLLVESYSSKSLRRCKELAVQIADLVKRRIYDAHAKEWLGVYEEILGETDGKPSQRL